MMTIGAVVGAKMTASAYYDEQEAIKKDAAAALLQCQNKSKTIQVFPQEIVGESEPEKMEQLSDEALNTFIENGKKDFAETAKLFNADIKEETTKSSEESSTEDIATEMEDQALELMGVKEKTSK